MAKMNITAAVAEDRDVTVIHLFEEGKGALGHIKLDAPALDGFIRSLSRCRERMANAVSPLLEPFARIENVADTPAWSVSRPNAGPPDRALLALRHPGFGGWDSCSNMTEP
jgi:hypothetical protein